ncbi:MAG: chromate transporter [Deltaproteobacteria bacterium]|nr:chromate transporter [Deltaproteobacteria bacterium]MBI3294630.1 chromate transporter [Deltaproteobacteria bacterium]
MPTPPSLPTVAVLFLKLGAMGFGGPVALVALMESELSRQRKWISARDFTARFVICKLLPGPVAYQMALWIGYHVRGIAGGLVAGVSFLLPGAALILLLAVLYQSIAHLTFGLSLIAGMRVGALVVIWDSAVRLFEPFYRRGFAWVLMAIGFVLMLEAPGLEPVIILSGGAAMVWLKRPARLEFSPWLLVLLFWIHFKAGAFTFGTGLAIIPVLQHQAVEVYHWLTTHEFLDAVAFGQVTPGPVTLTSTFIGYRAAGFLGAFAATLGMYLPGCLVILGVMPFAFPRLERAPWLSLFCDGAIPVVIGCIFAASLALVSSALVDKREMILGFVLLILNVQLKLSGWKVIVLSTVLYQLIHLT